MKNNYSMKVTVFTSCYNQAEFLRESIESVLKQTYINFEYFLYDDGSTDETWRIIEEYAKKDNRIIAERLPKQPTLSHIVNRCLNRYTGEIWTWCPADDIFEPNLLACKIKYQLENPNAVLYHNCLIINKDSVVKGESIVTVYTPTDIKRLVWEKSMIWMTGIFIPRSVFKITGGFPEHIQLSEDFYWMIKATIHNIDFIGVPEILHRKRKSQNQTSVKRANDIEVNVQMMRNELKEYKHSLRKIPKQVFFFWGNDKMSWMRYMTLKSFRMFNPDWKMILYLSGCNVENKQWTGIVEQDFFKFNGVDYTKKIEELNIEIRHWDISDNILINDKVLKNVSASHKSNFFKWHTLYAEGGIYSDLDIIYFKSMDNFYNELINNNYDTAICDTTYLSIGLLASAKNNDFYKDVFISCYNNYNPGEYQSAGVMSIHKMFGQEMFGKSGLTYNLYETINIAKSKYPHLTFYNIPFDLVYPLDSNKIEYAFTNDIKIADISKNAIGYHWYAGHPIAQKFNGMLTDDNYQNYNITYTNIAKEIFHNNNTKFVYVFLETSSTPVYSSHIFYDRMNTQIKNYLISKDNVIKTINIDNCHRDITFNNHVYFAYPTTVHYLLNKPEQCKWLLQQKIIFIVGENLDEKINTFIGWDAYKSTCNFDSGILYDFIEKSHIVTYQNDKIKKIVNKIRNQKNVLFFPISGYNINMLPLKDVTDVYMDIDILFYAGLNYPRRTYLMLEIIKYLSHYKIVYCNNIFDLDNLLKRSKIVLHINSVDNCYHIPYAKIIQPLLYNKVMLVEDTPELEFSDLRKYLHTFKYNKKSSDDFIKCISNLIKNFDVVQKKLIEMNPVDFIKENYNYDANIDKIVKLLK